MARRPQWWHWLQASKGEVRLAVDLYNRSGHERQLEAFIIHMALGCGSDCGKPYRTAGGDLYERGKRGWRKKHPEGGWVYRPLRTLLGEVFKANDPILANITFFIGLRNQIEHRHESQIAALVACKTQALFINYESSLVDFFGGSEALGTELRFPLFITADAVEALKKTRAQVPRGTLDWIQDFEVGLEAGLTADQRFDFPDLPHPAHGAQIDRRRGPDVRPR
jgi:hypothetical protein